VSSGATPEAGHLLPDGTGVAALVDGGAMDCGSGLLLLITRAIRRISPGELLGVRSEESSVDADLPVWAELVGHDLPVRVAESESGPWWFAVRKVVPAEPSRSETRSPATVFSEGEATPLGSRLWAYTNFDCNLACSYCCAASSPKAAARRLPVEVAQEAFAEFAAMGGLEVYLTGGEPWLHPDLAALVAAAEGMSRTILSNAMIFERGRRRETLESLDRSVVLQVSLDSAGPELHDRQRGVGSWARAMSGIGLAQSLGFRVRVAATLYQEDPVGVAELHRRLDEVGVAEQDRLIRPVAHEGFSSSGMHVSIDTLDPEPTITADGAYWHPVAVTNPNLRVADSPLPLAEVFGVVADTLAAQDAATRAGRQVFRCA
jgi:TusA-related sulfurtransferase